MGFGSDCTQGVNCAAHGVDCRANGTTHLHIEHVAVDVLLGGGDATRDSFYHPRLHRHGIHDAKPIAAELPAPIQHPFVCVHHRIVLHDRHRLATLQRRGPKALRPSLGAPVAIPGGHSVGMVSDGGVGGAMYTTSHKRTRGPPETTTGTPTCARAPNVNATWAPPPQYQQYRLALPAAFALVAPHAGPMSLRNWGSAGTACTQTCQSDCSHATSCRESLTTARETEGSCPQVHPLRSQNPLAEKPSPVQGCSVKRGERCRRLRDHSCSKDVRWRQM